MRILFATDGSPTSQTALEMLLALPLRTIDHVAVLSVPIHSYVGIGADGFGAYVAEIAEQEVDTARRIADTARDRLGQRGIPASSRIDDGPTARTIIDVAEDEGAALIVVGSRGLGLIGGTILGSVTRAVTAHARVPVLVVRDRRDAPTRILVAVDGSDDATAALRTLAALPLGPDIEVTLLHVQQHQDARKRAELAISDELRAALEREERQDALDILSAAKAALLPRGIVARVELDRGRASDRILEAAAAMGTDLIVLGARGRTLHRDRFLQGSTAGRVLQNAHCAVLVGRAPSDVRLGEAELEEVPALA